MENLAQTIKNFIHTDVNAELSALASNDVSLPAIAAKNIIIGTVDLSRYEAPVVVSILPETQSQEEDLEAMAHQPEPLAAELPLHPPWG